MSVRIVPWETGGWEVDIRLRLPNGERHRERKVLTGVSKSAAKRWGEDRQQHLLQHGLPQPQETKEVPTLKAFWPRFMDGHAKANHQKPSGIFAKEAIARVHLLPMFGDVPLNEITTERVQRLKARLRGRKPKTVNNVLTVLGTVLKKAVEWGVIERMPCTVRLLPVPPPSAPFHDFDDFERLIEAARKRSHDAYLVVLLGGEAGLRRGEIAALRWEDIDLKKRQLCVRRSLWKGHLEAPKGGRMRHVPLTTRLTSALREGRHLKGPFVFCGPDGATVDEKAIGDHVDHSSRAAGLKHRGAHVLRHSFCSHLAMKGAPARAIQELAGHKDLKTTQRYMHLSPAAIDSAIRLLECSGSPPGRGEEGETEVVEIANLSQ